MENSKDIIKIKIILGSTRQNRFSDKPGQWIFEETKKIDGVEAELLDLRDYQIPFFESSTPPSIAQGKYENEIIQKWSAKINEADAFIIVSPEYNHGYPAVLKNAMDVLYPEWNRKPVGFVSYGSAMGARVIEQLRLVAIELQMVPIRHAIHIPTNIFFQLITEQSPSNPTEIFETIRKSPIGDPVKKFFDDLLWWANALKKARMEI
jgi:NAD(P)H-dependent FMN reductase